MFSGLLVLAFLTSIFPASLFGVLGGMLFGIVDGFVICGRITHCRRADRVRVRALLLSRRQSPHRRAPVIPKGSIRELNWRRSMRTIPLRGSNSSGHFTLYGCSGRSDWQKLVAREKSGDVAIG